MSNTIPSIRYNGSVEYPLAIRTAAEERYAAMVRGAERGHPLVSFTVADWRATNGCYVAIVETGRGVYYSRQTYRLEGVTS